MKNATKTPEVDKSELAIRYAGLVKHIASRIAVCLPKHVDLDDLIHDGVVGLMDAINRYDASVGTKFETYASSRIRGAILDALRSRDWMSRGARRRLKELHRAEEQLCHRLGRQPNKEEVCDHTGMAPTEIERRRKESERGYVRSLFDPVYHDGAERVVDTIVEPRLDVEAEANRRSRKESLLRAIKTLKDREQLILSLYYFESLNIKEIGKVLGVSEARVSQLHTRSLKKLRKTLEEELES